MPTETDLPDPRDIERARTAEDRGRPRGNAEWARRRIEDGAQVRKVIWPPGPYVEIGPSPNFLLFDDGAHAGPQLVAQGAMFRGDETEDDLWEHHPPAPAVPTMHAPILWILYLFPRLGGADVVSALVAALESGHGSFAEHLIPIWAAAGDEATGREIVAALAKIERATFHRSLIGDVKTSMEILSAVTAARSKGPTP
jgi:hypothetical protein